MLNRTVSPAIKEPVEFDLVIPACEKHVLSNGVEVYALNMGNEDVLMVNWVFYAGNWYESKKAVAPAVSFLLKNGTSSRSAFNISSHFDYYGAYLNRSCYNETSEITLHCLSRHVSELLPVVAEMISDASFPTEELAIYQQNSRQRLIVNLQKSEFVAGRLIDANLFGEHHPYGKYSNPEDYTAIERSDLSAFYDKYYRNGRCVLFVAGKLPPDMLDMLEKHFGSLPLHSHRDAAGHVHHVIQPADGKKQLVINDSNGVQAAIRIARPFPNRHHPDFQRALVLNNVLGGFFGSRLMSNIREEKGYTYGIYSYILNHMHECGWMISTEAGRDVSEATVTEIYKELELLREEPIDEEELLMTKNNMIGSILGELDGAFQVIGRWKNMILNDLDDAYFYKGLRVIKTVSAGELQELARRYFQPEDFYELVVI